MVLGLGKCKIRQVWKAKSSCVCKGRWRIEGGRAEGSGGETKHGEGLSYIIKPTFSLTKPVLEAWPP